MKFYLRKALAALSGAALVLALVIGMPVQSAVWAQDAKTAKKAKKLTLEEIAKLSPEDKMKLMFRDFRKAGGKVSWEGLTDEAGILTAHNLKFVLKRKPKAKGKRSEKKSVTVMMTAERLVIRRYDWQHPRLPAYADGSLIGWRYDGPANADDPFRQGLKEAGLEALVMDADLKYQSNMKTGEVNVQKYRFAIRKVGEVLLSFKIDQVKFDQFPRRFLQPGFLRPRGVQKAKKGKSGNKVSKTPGEMLVAAFGNSRFYKLSLTVIDRGGVDRGLRVAAARPPKGKASVVPPTSEDMRKKLLASLRKAGSRLSGQLGTSLISAAQKFFTTPGKLTIKASPQQPVQFASFLGFAMMTAASTGKKGQKINLDALKGFLGLSVAYKAQP